jgi:lysophospholipase L1-like esterase
MRGAVTILVASASRPGASPLTMTLLLVMAVIAGDCASISALRGSSAEGARAAQRVGYYEALTDAPEQVPDRPAPGPPAGWTAFGGEESGIVREVPSYSRWTMKPDLDLRWNGAVFRTNHLGLRSPEIEPVKPDGTYRIIVLGSSNTMGYGVDNDQMYTYLLQRWLNERVGPSHRVEVVNLAVSADSPSRRLWRLQEEAGRLGPDWLLCDVSLFDAWLEDRHIHAALQRGLPIPFDFVRGAIGRTGVGPADSFDAFREKFRGESERMFEDVYAGWSAEARRMGVPLTLVILPRSDSKDKSTRLHRYILSLADRHSLDYLDVSDAFDALAVDEFRISEWDHHPNARGHAAIFEALRGALSRRGSLPGFPPRASGRRDPVPVP